MDQTTEDLAKPGRGSIATAAIGIASVIGALMWWGGADFGDGRVVCGSKFVVEPPDSAKDIQCRSKDSHDAQWHFMMPTDEVESWWAGQSETPLDLGTWLSTGGRQFSQDGDLIGTASGVSAHYPEDEDGYIVVNPKAGGRAEVFLNGSWE